MRSRSIKLVEPAFTGVAMNASGIIWNEATTQAAARSSTGAIVMKTVTSNGCTKGEGYVGRLPNGDLVNRIGLNNYGIDKHYRMTHSALVEAGSISKPIVASVNGSDAKLTELVEKTLTYPINMLEVNMSCPNVSFGILGYSLSNIERSMDRVVKGFPIESTVPIAVKLPYYPNLDMATKVAMSLSTYPRVRYITAINTIPGSVNSRGDDVQNFGTSRLLTKFVNVGVSGPGIKPMALHNVAHYHRILRSPHVNSPIKIIGCGGIETHQDVQDYLDAGASYVQVGTGMITHGASIFDKL